jgi:DNA-directed RNA polymerase subunit RPC12/RpoP
MAIYFDCSQCGAPFVVEERLAGRAARCKRCGSRTTIPGTREGAAAAAAAPAGRAVGRAGAAEAAAVARPSPPKPAAPVTPAAMPLNWIDAVTSQVALAPITEQRLSALRKKPTPLDDASFTGLYKVASAPSLPALKAARGKPAGVITRTYRHEMGKIQGLFRWLNQSAYLVSVPFLMILLIGVVVNNQSVMALGGVVVVALNIGRLIAGVANLAVIPFRDSPIQGVLFLIPPITFFYLAKNWNKVRKPVQRIIGPIVTIGLVALAFVVGPMLHSGLNKNESIKDQVSESVGSAKKAIRRKLGDASSVNAGDLDVGKLLPKAREALKALEGQGTDHE